MGRRSSDVHEDRLLLGEHAIISVEEAVRRLPMSDSDARTFLRDRNLIRCPNGKHTMVVWGDVVAAVQGFRESVRRHSQRASRDADIIPPKGRVDL